MRNALSLRIRLIFQLIMFLHLIFSFQSCDNVSSNEKTVSNHENSKNNVDSDIANDHTANNESGSYDATKEKNKHDLGFQKYKDSKDLGFDKFPTNNNLAAIRKAKLNINSNQFTKTYKSRVSEFYKDAEINFSGKYSLIFWDIGMGQTQGILIDCITGNAFDTPINDGIAFNGCFNEDKLKIYTKYFGDDKVFCRKESNLLVLRSCDEYEQNSIVFHFYLWEEETKQFKLLKIEKISF